MQVVALTHFMFAGKQRKPGTTIAESDWNETSETARAALINGGHVRVGTGEKTSAAARTAIGEGEGETDQVLLLQGISAKLDRALGGLAKAGLLDEVVEAPKLKAAAPAKKTAVKAKRRKVKAKKPKAPAASPLVHEDE